jgi:hypothetical protein
MGWWLSIGTTRAGAGGKSSGGPRELDRERPWNIAQPLVAAARAANITPDTILFTRPPL